MKIIDYKNIKAENVDDPAAKGVTIRWLISEKDNATNFAMRLFEVEPGGFTPFHEHPSEHEVFIVRGEGNLVGESQTQAFKQGDAIFVPGDEKHQFKNASNEVLAFLCMVPIDK